MEEQFYFIFEKDVASLGKKALSKVEKNPKALRFDLNGNAGWLFSVDDIFDVLASIGMEETKVNNTNMEGVLSVSLPQVNGEKSSDSKRVEEIEKLVTSEEHIQQIKKDEKINFVRVCKGDVDMRLENLTRNITSYEDAVTSTKKELVHHLKQRDDAISKLKNLRVDRVYGKEYDALMSMEQVRSLKIDGDRLKVFTDTLYCENPKTGKIHEIGKFRIEIPINGIGKVRWFNLDRQIEIGEKIFHAPHVSKNGKACFGNTGETFSELIENYEFAAVTMIAIAFIESVNMKDAWGKNIVKWPVATKKTVYSKVSRSFWRKWF